jgi:putative transposase
VLQALIDTEATQHIGAGRDERTDTRTAIATAPARGCCPQGRCCGAAHPQAGGGRVLPALLEPRRRIDRALLAVVMEA